MSIFQYTFSASTLQLRMLKSNETECHLVTVIEKKFQADQHYTNGIFNVFNGAQNFAGQRQLRPTDHKVGGAAPTRPISFHSLRT